MNLFNIFYNHCLKHHYTFALNFRKFVQGAKFIIKVPVKASLSLIDNSSDPNYSLMPLTKPFLIALSTKFWEQAKSGLS